MAEISQRSGEFCSMGGVPVFIVKLIRRSAHSLRKSDGKTLHGEDGSD